MTTNSAWSTVFGTAPEEAAAQRTAWSEVIPAHMQQRAQWVRWADVPETGQKKVPHVIGSGAKAKSNDPTTWRSFEEAAKHQESDPRVGYVFTLDDGLVFIDVDDCLIEGGIVLKPWAKPLVQPFVGRTYIEVSPSGTGLHVFVRGTWRGSRSRYETGDGAVEVYTRGRYSTITGNNYGDSDLLDEAQDEVDALLEALEPKREIDFTKSDRSENRYRPSGNFEDRERIVGALDAIPPDIDYERWTKIGMALAAEYERDGAGLALWQSWSSRGEKYKSGECEQKWKSFRRNGVNIGTLFHIAKESGWNPRNDAYRPRPVNVARDDIYAEQGQCPPVQAPEAPVTGGDAPEDLEDLRTAARFVERARGRFVWVYRQGGGAWHGWDGHRWGRDDARAVYVLAAEVARSFLADAASATGEKQKALIAQARKAQQAQRIEAAVRLAATAFPDLKAPTSSFDTDEWTINTPSGLVDLRTGNVRPTRPDDRVTMLAGAEYDPAARSARFDCFLEEVLPNPEVRAYVQRAAGYTITGSTREHAMFLPVGGGRNGKGVLLRLFLRALGDYGRTAAAGLLLERHGGEAHLTELASLDGARFVFASEVPPRSRWNEPRLKQLTGGDPVTARFMRQDEFTFMPKCKVWLAMNERPKVVGTSDAIWARLKEIPFPVQFRDADDPRPEVQRQPVKDPRLEEELIPGALPAVLAWAVAGALEWQRRGLGEPPEVRKAVQEYRTTQDHVGPFLADHPVVDKVRLRDLFKSWTTWCAEENEKPGSQADLAAALRAKGYEVRVSTGGATFVFPIELPLLPASEAVRCLPPDSDLVRIARARESLIPETPHSNLTTSLTGEGADRL